MLAVTGVLYLVTQAVMSWLMSLLKVCTSTPVSLPQQSSRQALAPTVRTTIAPYIRCVMIFNSGVNVLVYYAFVDIGKCSTNADHVQSK